MSSQHACQDCKGPTDDERKAIDRDPPMYNDMKLGKRSMNMRAASPSSPDWVPATMP